MQATFSRLIPTKLISNKVNRTAKATETVERTLLLNELNRAEFYPMTLVIAPAGYGKTTLVCQWKEKQLAKNQRIGWYSLDESDNKTEQFSAYFTAALSQATDLSFSRIVYQNNLVDYFSQLLIQLSQVRSHFYLVIDDYHHIENS